MNWEKSDLGIWWQARLGKGLLPISVRAIKGKYVAAVGIGYAARESVFATQKEAQTWAIKEARKVLAQMTLETYSRYPLLEICLLLAIALHIVWLTANF